MHREGVPGGGNGYTDARDVSVGKFEAHGGCGNPGGKGSSRTGLNSTHDGLTGTGGLLVIYSSRLENSNGRIVSNGIGYKANIYNKGGSSGGGSINIFYEKSMINGQIEANGGENAMYRGGNGSISVGNISSGYYENTYKNY